MVKATGGTDGSDLKWTPGVLLIKTKDENVTRPSPAAFSTPIKPSVEAEMLLPPESLGNKKLCLQGLTAEHIAKIVAPLAITRDYSEGDLVGYT